MRNKNQPSFNDDNSDDDSDPEEQKFLRREKWLHRKISSAEKARMARFALAMDGYYAAVAAWEQRVIAATGVTEVGDSKTQTEVRDYVERINPNDPHPSFWKFMQTEDWKTTLRNPELWVDSTNTNPDSPRLAPPKPSTNPYDYDSDTRWDNKMKTWWPCDVTGGLILPPKKPK